jgi:hypothetical protein
MPQLISFSLSLAFETEDILEYFDGLEKTGTLPDFETLLEMARRLYLSLERRDQTGSYSIFSDCHYLHSKTAANFFSKIHKIYYFVVVVAEENLVTDLVPGKDPNN